MDQSFEKRATQILEEVFLPCIVSYHIASYRAVLVIDAQNLPPFQCVYCTSTVLRPDSAHEQLLIIPCCCAGFCVNREPAVFVNARKVSLSTCRLPEVLVSANVTCDSTHSVLSIILEENETTRPKFRLKKNIAHIYVSQNCREAR